MMNTLVHRRWAMRRFVGPRIIDLREAAARRKTALRASRLGSKATGPLDRDGTADDDDDDGSDGPGQPRERDPDRRAKVLVVVAIVVGLLGIFGSWMWAATSDQRALRALPAPRRAQLLHNSLENLTTVCDPYPPRSLQSFCREQAEVAVSFHECDSTCLGIARRHLHPPVR